MDFLKAKELGATASGLVLGVSALHVVCAAIYLYFYCVGFGANISMFFSAPDIFSISITKLAGVYLLSLLWPLLIYGSLFLLKVKTNDEWIASAPTPEGANRRHRNMRLVAKICAVGFTVQVAFVLFVAFQNWWSGEVFSASATLTSICMSVMFIIILVKSALPNGLALGFFFFCGVVGGAIDNGQFDRHATYNTTRSLPMCNGFKVLTKASSNYVAIGNQGTKVLLTQDCKVAFVFPRPTAK